MATIGTGEVVGEGRKAVVPVGRPAGDTQVRQQAGLDVGGQPDVGAHVPAGRRGVLEQLGRLQLLEGEHHARRHHDEGDDAFAVRTTPSRSRVRQPALRPGPAASVASTGSIVLVAVMRHPCCLTAAGRAGVRCRIERNGTHSAQVHHREDRGGVEGGVGADAGGQAPGAPGQNAEDHAEGGQPGELDGLEVGQPEQQRR